MSTLVVEVVERLRAAGTQLSPGLSDREVEQVQDRFNFAFGPEHREFLQQAVPLGDRWADWRNGSTDDLRRRLDWPVEGVLFDVHENEFWPLSWGARPHDRDVRDRRARVHLEALPGLVPLYSHRYLTVDTQFVPSPVFSVHQTDVIIYGDNLLDYVAHEFGAFSRHPTVRPRVPFWSDLATGAEDSVL